ncbi:MAG: hypothetical protein QXF58_04220 [Desulfurococcaceae archaeon]
MSVRGRAGGRGTYTLTVKIKFDRSSLDELRKQLEDAFKGAAARAGRAGRGGREGDETGIALKGIFGKLTAAVAIGQAVLKLVEKIASAALEVSPAFKQLLKLVSLVIGLFLKPILDILAVTIMPVMIALLKWFIIPFNRSILPYIKQIIQHPTGGIVGGLVGGVAGWIGGGIAGAKIGAMIGVSGGPIGAGIGAVIGFVLGAIFGSKVEEWLENIDWSGMGKKIEEAFSGFSKWITEKLSPISQALETAWNNFTKWVGENFGKIGEKIGGAWENVKNWVLENLGKIGEKIGSDWEKFKNWIAENLGKIGDVLGMHWNNFKTWIQEKLGGIGAALGAHWSNFETWIKEKLGKIAEKLGPAWNSFTSWISSNLGGISEKIGGAWEKFKNWINDNFGKIKDWIGDAWNKVVEFFNKVKEGIRPLKEAWDKVAKFFGNLGKTVSEWAGGVLGWLFPKKQFGGIVERSGLYWLEAGERVIPPGRIHEAAPRNVEISLNVVVTGTIYGEIDLENVIRKIIKSELGEILYRMGGGRVRALGL